MAFRWMKDKEVCVALHQSQIKIVLLLSRLTLGGVFVYASFHKILHPYESAEVVYSYLILPDELVNLTAILLPWLELCMGLFLILDLFLPGTAFMSSILLAVFFAALAFNLARGLDIDCGCFATSASPSAGSQMLWFLFRNALFLALALHLLSHLRLKERKDP
jgi:uncharacterized membrane protein YphA (DoxX/SURF4 family)